MLNKGDKFNRLTIVKFHHRQSCGNRHRYYYLCKCDCGKETIVRQDKIKNLHTQSCGCLQRETVRITTPLHSTKHGECRNGKISKEYTCYKCMIQRCYDKNSSCYCNYGEKGIKVSNRWLESFENFLKDMGRKPTLKHSIDRIDYTKGYSKENCRWATSKEQNNNKSSNRYIKVNDITKTLSQWTDYLKIKGRKLYKRDDKYIINLIKQIWGVI